MLHRVALMGTAPGLVVAVGPPAGTSGESAGSPGGSDVPLLRDRPLVGGTPAAYVCRQFTCDAPVTTEDALAIYAQKIQITEQIEVLKGQIQYYEQSVAKSAISIRLQAKESMAPLTIAGWQPSGVAKKALQALIDFGNGFVNFIIWLGIFVLPVVLVIGLPLFFIIRALVRRNRRKQAANLEALKRAMQDKQPPLPQ